MTECQNYRMTELQNDRQDKNNMPPDLQSRGHKKSNKEKINLQHKPNMVMQY